MAEETYTDRIRRIRSSLEQEAVGLGSDPVDLACVLIDAMSAELDAAERRVSAGFTRHRPQMQH